MSDIFRRDPRAEWIARNRLHPLHQASQQGPVYGPSGLLRKNLHGIGFIGPNGLKRIDRSGSSSGESSGRRGSGGAQVEVVLPLHQISEPEFYIVVALDLVSGRLNGHDKDTLGLAQQLANREGAKGAVIALAFGELKDDSLDKAGVDRLIHLSDDRYDDYDPEQRCRDLSAIVEQFDPLHILLPDSINGGGDLGRRLAAKLNFRPACGVWKVDHDSIVCRGSAGKSDITRSLSRLLLVMEECSEPVSETRHEQLALTVELNGAESNVAQSKIIDHGSVDVDPNAIPLGEAGFILSGGNGIADWSGFHNAAIVLGATEGASRVAVDDGFMPRERQVGATGTWVTAKVYIAVGISGAIQHMQGIGQCDKVVAINTDEGCDMVKRADLSTIGDSSEILANLVNLVEEYKAGATQDVA